MLGLEAFESKTSVALAGTNPSVTSTRIDSSNNLLLNGRPFLLIQGEGLDYNSWQQSGYIEATADAKIVQAQAAGLNCIWANWNQTSFCAPPYTNMYQDLIFWQKFGIYWHGHAHKGVVVCNPVLGDPTSLNQMVTNINAFKGRSNLMLWAILGEADLTDTHSAPDPVTYYRHYVAAAELIRQSDPGHPVVSSDVVRSGPVHNWGGHFPSDNPHDYYWDELVNSQGVQIPLVEMVLNSGPMAWYPLSKLYEYLDLMNRRVLANPSGLGWIPSISTTPLPELFGGPGRIPTFGEIYRWFMLQVAFNCRAFSVLWGPNQRTSYPNTGDAGLPPGYLDVWNRTWQAVGNIKSLESVILAPGNWIQIPTTPGFVPFDFGSNRPFKGIYAAKKSVSGATYVIAINSEEDAASYNELAVRGAKLDLGRAIRSATRLFNREGAGPSANPPVSFSGSAIAQDFAPMQVHVYKVFEI